MIKIRMTRTGKKNDSHYRIVVMESTGKRDCQYIELIGHYTPGTINRKVVIKEDILQKWIERGAQMSDSVSGLLKTINKEKNGKESTVKAVKIDKKKVSIKNEK